MKAPKSISFVLIGLIMSILAVIAFVFICKAFTMYYKKYDVNIIEYVNNIN